VTNSNYCLPSQRVSRHSVLVTDLDNTLYDWLAYYMPGFLAMVDVLARQTGRDPDTLKASFKRVHERHRSTEYSFSLQELDVLAEDDSGLSAIEIYQKYDEAIHAFRSARSTAAKTVVYPGVRETLASIRASGYKIVAATESLRYHAVQRLKHLNLEGYFDALLVGKDHPFPSGLAARDIRLYGTDYDTTVPVVIEVSSEIRKPNPAFIAPLLEALGIEGTQMVYVGDSIVRDVQMARRIGAVDVYAQYGTRVDPTLTNELRKITYWTSHDVENDTAERAIAQPPTHSIDGFAEVQRFLGS
jgi:phosphoglycolate phosphatase-like HAD superfamily hydrolase